MTDRPMLEKMARAMHTYAVTYTHNIGMHLEHRDWSWRVHKITDCDPFEKNEWEGEFDNKADARRMCAMLNARAVLAVLRNPTPEMVEAGEEWSCAYCREPDDFLHSWQAAIDAAAGGGDG